VHAVPLGRRSRLCSGCARPFSGASGDRTAQRGRGSYCQGDRAQFAGRAPHGPAGLSAACLAARAPRPPAAQRMRAAAMFGGDDDDMQEGLEQGTRVRVKSTVTVYHAPKLGDLNLEGKEGTVQDARAPAHRIPHKL
jgi:hypothetical protein